MNCVDCGEWLAMYGLTTKKCVICGEYVCETCCIIGDSGMIQCYTCSEEVKNE